MERYQLRFADNNYYLFIFSNFFTNNRKHYTLNKCVAVHISGVAVHIFNIVLIHKSGQIFKISVVHFWEFITGHANFKYTNFQDI